MTHESFNDCSDPSQLTAEVLYEQRRTIDRMLATRDALRDVKWTLAGLFICSLVAFLVSWYRLAVEWSIGSWFSGALYMGIHSCVLIAIIWSMGVAAKRGRSI